MEYNKSIPLFEWWTITLESCEPMNSKFQKILLYIPTAALGLWCMTLQSRILGSGFDQKGLLMRNNPTLILLWAVTGVFLIAVLAMTARLGGNGTYEENFPKCPLSGTAMIAAGLIMGFHGLNGLMPGQMGSAVFSTIVGIAMMVCGGFRIMGKRPVFVLDLIVGLYYAVHLLGSYSGWNADPRVQRYAFQLLSGAAVMLFSIHRARCAVGSMDRRKLVFMGFAGMFLSLIAIAGGEGAGFYAASGLWCAGAMCDLKKLDKPSTPEAAGQTEAPEKNEETGE